MKRYFFTAELGGAFVAVSLILGVALPANAAPDPDSDGDGYSDAVETATHSNPFDKNITPGRAIDIGPSRTPPASGPDTDGDGLADKDELRHLTNVFLPDSDGDGLSDGQEVNNKTNPLNIFDN